MNIWDIEQPISLPQAQMGYRIRRAVVGASVTPKAPSRIARRFPIQCKSY